MKNLVIFISIGLLVLVAYLVFRPSPEIRRELLLADSLMQIKPDSSLRILQRINKPQKLSGENQALYALLMTQAQFKNDIPITSDSLLRIAVNYYETGKDSLRKGWTFLYLGKIRESEKEEKKALECYHKASIAASVTTNYKLLKLLYNYWGSLLMKKKPYEEGIDKLKKSLEYAILRNDTIGQIYVLRDLGLGYIWKKDLEASLRMNNKGIMLAKNVQNKALLSSIYNNTAIVYQEKKQYRQALNYIDSSLVLNKDTISNRSSYYMKASLFLDLRHYDSARYYINKAGLGNSFYSKAGYYDFLSELEEKLGNYKTALTRRNQYCAYVDSIEINKEDMELIALQRKYDYSLIANENNMLKLKSQRETIFILIIFLVLITSAWIFYVYYTKERQRKEEMIRTKDELLQQSYIQIQEKTIQLQKHQEDLHVKEKELNTYLQKEKKMQEDLSLNLVEIDSYRQSQAELKKTIEQKEAELYAHKQKEQELKEHIFKMDHIVKKIRSIDSLNPFQRIKQKAEIVLSPQELSNLLEAINLCYDNFAVRLQENFPKLSEGDIYICCLLKMKIPAKNIAILLESNETALKKRKYRIKHDKMNLPDKVTGLEEYLANY